MNEETDHPEGSKNVKVSGAIQARFTPEFLKDIKTGQEQEHARETSRSRVEIATLIVVFAYTSVALWQGCSSQKAANAAKNSAEISGLALQRGQRAFVYFSEAINTTMVVDPNNRGKINEVQFNVPIKNSGPTPPEGLTFKLRIYPSQQALPDDFDYPDATATTPQLIVLGPHQETVSQWMGVEPEIIKAVQERIVSGSNIGQRLYFYGSARYWDVFQDRKTDAPHITNFCYELARFDTSSKIPTFFNDCPHHNCTDEDCQTEK